MRSLLFGCAAVLLIAAPAFAQSLASVGRQEEARRHEVKAPSKAYTNSSLTPDPRGASSAGTSQAALPPASTSAPSTESSEAAGAAATTPPTDAAAAAASADSPSPAEPALIEEFWRRRAADLRDRVEKARAQVARMEGLTHDDPREQAKLDALAKRADTALAQAEEATRAFATEAANVGVPPNWIR